MGSTVNRSVRAVSCTAVAAGLAFAMPHALMAQKAAPLSAAAPAAEVGSVPAWDIASTDFPADPDITFGRLPNGMRYALMRNANPKGETAIRFTVGVGSREETDEENGAAHFVEHMAFNGSQGIPEGQLLPMLERLGLSFGADTNAETGLDYTTYKLQLPRTDEETVGTALKVIREMAGELTLEPAAVDRERGIILNEAQVRIDPGRRRVADYLRAALTGSRVGERVRADEERIRNISPAQLRAFYDAYYRPERATLVIVGDFDVGAMEARIQSNFSDWRGEGAAREIYQSPVSSGIQVPTIGSFVDPAIPEIVELQRISAWEPAANTISASRNDLLRAVAAAALSNRMNALARTADSPTLGAQAADQPLFRSARSFGLLAVAKDWQWAETLALAERELRRAHTFGFTAAEIAESAAVAVTPPAEEAEVQWAYGAWGEPGVVVADETIADLGIRTVRFANGLQLNLKVTIFEPGKVGFRLRIGSGLAAFPTDRPGLREMLPIIASIDGFEAHSIDDLRRVLAGKAVGLGFDGEEDALIAYGETTSADLKLQLDLLGARLAASGWRPETLAQWAGIAPIIEQNVRANPAQLLSLALGAVLAGNDARFGLNDPGKLAQLSIDDLRAIVAPQLKDGPLALGLVGDFNAEEAISTVAATLGALPARSERREDVGTAAPARFVVDRSVKLLTHTGAADQGAITVSWPGTDGRDLKDDITRDLLADVLTLRLTEKLREELGATYSPSAFSYAPLAFEGFGHITAFATVPPEAMDETAAAIRAIAGELAGQPPSADLLERARAPMRANYERAETQNADWLGLVAEAQSNPSLLDRRRQRRAVLDAITPADLQAMAKRYLTSEAPVEIRVVAETTGNE